ncbi:GSCFA domain-containing protein [Hymenobacter lucidus]|uniref:GSCFA domain-containing protein n=1 Tax=Hymenobacter lucidus TaxID=2880930 RepID=A0ABS8AMU1_9BACT|nr:GSCFA domain-containing protein [Hymenobacter lucidus]MCB2407535.1 GSCFA domain-containing protein [Hymenobacter lucidus]
MFRTELPLTPHPQQLPLSAQVLTVGSCFSDTIGSRLAATKVKTLINPFGTVFNPLSACQLLRAAAGEDQDWQQHLVEARGRWQSYDLHATIGADSPVTLLQQIQELMRETGEFLQNTDVVMLTLGTAYAYRLLETDEVVNNCHKVPAERFEKVLLTPDEIINAVAETHAYLRRANPKLRFILTVSPVRHLKDTLPLNSVSKSVLRVACHYLSELLPDVSYFPAYELLLDDLRDYRFYASDMLHPSETAENYIWERFTRTYFDSNFGRFRREWESVRQALAHRPLYAEAPEHREFLEATLARLQKLATQADVQAEMQEIERQLVALPKAKAAPLPEPEPDDDEERIDIGEPADQPVYLASVPTPLPVPAPTPVPSSTPPVAELTAADDAEDDEDDDSEEESLESAAATEAPLFPKKKRRSRGGAKRTARKKAAQLYAQQAAEAAAATVSEAVTSSESEEVLSTTPAEPESYSAPVQAPVVPVATPEPVASEAQPQPVVAEAARPVAAVRTPIPQPRPEPKADWLQVMDDDDSDEELSIPEQPEPKAPARSKGGRAGAEKKPRVAKDRIITTPPRANRKKPAPLYAEAPAEPITPPVEPPATAAPTTPVVAEPVVAVTPAPVAPPEAASTPAAPEPMPEATPAAAVKKPRAKAAAKPKPEAKPVAKPAAKVAATTRPKLAKPQAAPAEAAQAPAAKPKPAKPKVSKAKTPPPPAPAPAPEAPQAEAPKKRSRPPRKKAAADETPSAS